MKRAAQKLRERRKGTEQSQRGIEGMGIEKK